VARGHAGDLGQVRDAEDLPPARDPLELPAHFLGHGAPMPASTSSKTRSDRIAFDEDV